MEVKVVVDQQDIREPFSLDKYLKANINQPKFSDVCFEVEGKKIYAIKSILAIGSEVFERMFYSNALKMLSDESTVVIKDLTYNGFLNMSKYLYGYSVDEIELKELYETYRAADKYMVYDMADRLMNRFKSDYDFENALLFYDQLLRFEEKEHFEVLMNEVKFVIQSCGDQILKNDQILDINQTTLLNVLMFESLNISEFDILKAVSRWTTAECLRSCLKVNPTNKRNIFKPFKRLIDWSLITVEQLREFNTIEELLTFEEVASLFVYLLDQSKKFVLNTDIHRKLFKYHETLSQGAISWDVSKYTESEFAILLNVNKSIILSKIHTFIPESVKNFRFTIFENEIDLEIENYFSNEDKMVVVEFEEDPHIDKGKDYKLVFTFDAMKFSPETDKLSSNNKIEHRIDDDCFIFNLNFDRLSCIEKFTFFISSYHVRTY